MILRNLFLSFLLILVTNCGFKAVDQNFFKNYNFVETNITGDKKIVYLLKNKINKNNETASKSIKLDIKTDKIRNIKEKNIQNEITKYEISITANVIFYVLDNNEKGEFRVSNSGDYNVSSRHSITLDDEKKLIKNLVTDLTDQILRNLKTKLDEL